MTRELAPAWLAVGTASLAAVALAAHSAANACAAATRSHDELARVIESARELLTLRAAASSPATKRAGAGLAQRVTAALTRAGLATSALSSLSPESQSVQVDGQSRFTRQRATLVLTSVTLPQLGSFLDAWRSAEPDWTITTLDLAPPTSTVSATPVNSTGGDLPLRTVLTLESVSVEEPAPSPSLFLQTPTGGPR